ncbi:hypothetical protein Lesp02_42620 [Lentzea sp. NBRC 105346]|nr:hypothetical protein Lesp02_42620 [Lentzea sp. NBRC 105346]
MNGPGGREHGVDAAQLGLGRGRSGLNAVPVSHIDDLGKHLRSDRLTAAGRFLKTVGIVIKQ